jgi:hypothetical protein
VAGGVLIEQRVEEHEAAFRDRRGVRHERDLAEAASAFIAVEHFSQHFLAALGLSLDDTPRLESDRDAVDQRALIGERLGADDVAGSDYLHYVPIRTIRKYGSIDQRIAGVAR